MNMHISFPLCFPLCASVATTRVTWRCFHTVWASNSKAEGPRRRQSSLLAAVQAASALHTINRAASRCSFIWPAHIRVFHQIQAAFHPSVRRPVLRINAIQLNSAFGSRSPHFVFFKATLEVANTIKEKSLNCTMVE